MSSAALSGSGANYYIERVIITLTRARSTRWPMADPVRKIKVTRDGRATIPKEIRMKPGTEEGTVLLAEATADVVTSARWRTSRPWQAPWRSTQP